MTTTAATATVATSPVASERIRRIELSRSDERRNGPTLRAALVPDLRSFSLAPREKHVRPRYGLTLGARTALAD